MGLPQEDTPDPDLEIDPGYIKWAAEQDAEDIEIQDGDTSEEQWIF